MSKKKKIVISVLMVLLLAATAYLNILISGMGNGEDTTVSTNFFTEYRTERVSTREQEMLYLDGIIANTSLSAETVDAAAAQKLELVDLMEKELTLEGLIKAKGFEDVAITMSSANDNVNVIVKCAELTQEDVANIYSVLAEEVNATFNNVKIIPVE
ncbi:MAG: SpoIIIAH-like family protein [Clostridia bacterium]|nr:SpoIIIAH-like family protein [Clostridia bacterium]MBR2070559.1 SpoIIIAH-like family protein [Clostridia bacterium]MBR2323990.1 SpoIIIAH-like family protein [Clostridia bacterium]MBR2496167.1 SpoIIIAH-like family protein [Clostridia bacterium]MBR2875124.1 SpoIIIAH-like family protein [Clostridia bacterium]